MIASVRSPATIRRQWHRPLRPATALVLSAAVLASCSSGDGGAVASLPSIDPSSASSIALDTTPSSQVSSDSSSDPVQSDPVQSDPVSSDPVQSGSVVSGQVPPDTSAPPGALPVGFSTVTARITEADGEVCDVCLWLADSADERGRGLMGVDDLGDAVGMAFVFEQPILGTFYMFETPTPLSIAWFGPDGAWVGSADMAPCLDTPADECARYRPEAEYDLAIEVFADAGAVGGDAIGDDALAALGLGPGAVVEVLVGTEGLDCQTPSS
jgi:uncharacterized protein